MNGWKTNGKLNEEWRKGHVSTCDSITKVQREASFAWGSILFPDVTGKGFTGCWGPAPAGSRGTLRMNGIGEWERQWDKAQGWVWSLFSHGPFIPLTTSFWGKCILLTHRSSQNIILPQLEKTHETSPSLRDEARFPCIVSRAIAFSQSNT